ncbi:hypothetical protein SCP_1000200 [Sparassis crispa]|uniref:Uncharacterized protein n=1 Tax=Sparassis crispa TaxID=139825 RepID=A0A401GX15_9APHY|nr:hypothetical protein SCP_1000200 [Sparassis crispa]GBE86778.1 hypothetical protein SCP_1000200 [Sparassis crispa]
MARNNPESEQTSRPTPAALRGTGVRQRETPGLTRRIGEAYALVADLHMESETRTAAISCMMPVRG